MDKHGFTVGVIALSIHNVLSALAIVSLFGIYFGYREFFVPLLFAVLSIDIVVILAHMAYRYRSGALREISPDLRPWIIIHSLSSMFAIAYTWTAVAMAFTFLELIVLCITWSISLVTGDVIFIRKYRSQ